MSSDILLVIEQYLLDTALHPTTDLYALIGGKSQCGAGPDQADPLIDVTTNPTETCLLLRYLSRISKIDVSGYSTTHLARVNWQIEINCISKASGAAASDAADAVEALLLPDSDVAYDGSTDKIHVDSISRVPQWDSGANFYRECLTIRGNWWFAKE